MKEYIKPRIITMAIAPVTMIASSDKNLSSTTPVSGIDNSMGNGGDNDGSHTVGAKPYDVWAEIGAKHYDVWAEE